MKDEMDRSKKELEEVMPRLGDLPGSFVEVSGFLAVRNMVSRHDRYIVRLRQAAVCVPGP